MRGANLRGGVPVHIKLNGAPFEVRADADIKYRVSGETRTTVMRADGLRAGYTSEGQPGYVEFTIIDSADLSIAALNAASGVEVSLEHPNGKMVLAANSDRVGDPLEADVKSGSVGPVRFEGEVDEL